MCLQSAVERHHYLQRCNTSALCNIVYRTWSKGNLDRCISNVFGRLNNVMCNLIQVKGSNDLVEKKPGKKQTHKNRTSDERYRKRNTKRLTTRQHFFDEAEKDKSELELVET